MSEKQHVRITFSSIVDGKTERKQDFQGEFYPKDKSFYIRYEEEDELLGSVRTLLRWSGEELKLTRHGGVEWSKRSCLAAAEVEATDQSISRLRWTRKHLRYPLSKPRMVDCL